MKILITGANGMVASAAVRHCRSIGDEITAFTREQLDISSREAVFEMVGQVSPDAVINCAAYTDVDGSEKNQRLCREVNALGAENLALAAKNSGSAFLTISTDYVFGGDKAGFYTQRDTPRPLNFYGIAKLEAEVLVKTAYARSIIVRSGWIFGTGGSNFLSTIDGILSRKDPVKAIDDSFGTPTFADDLARRIRELVKLDLPLTFHVSNPGERMSFYDFAQAICTLQNYDQRLVDKISTNNLSRPAKRPVNSALRCLFSRAVGLEPLPPLESSLKDFLRT